MLCRSLISEKNIKLFEKYNVLSEREMHSRYEIYVERYCKDVNMESLTALTMAKTEILPAALKYQGELAEIAVDLKALGKNPHTGSLDTLTDAGRRLGRQDRQAGSADRAPRHRRSDGPCQALPRRSAAGDEGRPRRRRQAGNDRRRRRLAAADLRARCCSSSSSSARRRRRAVPAGRSWPAANPRSCKPPRRAARPGGVAFFLPPRRG